VTHAHTLVLTHTTRADTWTCSDLQHELSLCKTAGVYCTAYTVSNPSTYLYTETREEKTIKRAVQTLNLKVP
jgi:hypothetical protein